MKQLAWLDKPGEKFKVLHINEGKGWIPYSSHPAAAALEKRFRGKGDTMHSKGWFAYQALKCQGYELIATEEAMKRGTV